MKVEAEELLDRALQLPADARAELAGRLLRSLDEEQEDFASAVEYDAAWSEELRRRIEQIDDGTVEAIPWDEARRRIGADDDSSSR
jgi:putative addiction module component (TIGR02574 family)